MGKILDKELEYFHILRTEAVIWNHLSRKQTKNFGEKKIVLFNIAMPTSRNLFHEENQVHLYMYIYFSFPYSRNLPLTGYWGLVLWHSRINHCLLHQLPLLQQQFKSWLLYLQCSSLLTWLQKQVSGSLQPHEDQDGVPGSCLQLTQRWSWWPRGE